jgi:hypothetical protein
MSGEMQSGAMALKGYINDIRESVVMHKTDEASLISSIAAALSAADELRKAAKAAGLRITVTTGKPRGRKPKARPMIEPTPPRPDANGGDPNMPGALRR